MQRVLRHPLSIRIFHWVQMISIVMLSMSGFYITSPFNKLIFNSMYSARSAHFIFMWILTATFVFRFYLFFAEKKARDILFNIKDIKTFPALIKYMLFLNNEHPYSKKYNVGQKVLYSFWFILVALQIVTGFILYYPAKLSGLALTLGGFMVIRLIHNATFWFFACTVLLHIYLDMTEGKEIALSMFNGYASVPEHLETLTVPALDGIADSGLVGKHYPAPKDM